MRSLTVTPYSARSVVMNCSSKSPCKAAVRPSVTAATAPEGHIVAKLIEIQPADPAGNADDVDAVKDGLTGALQGDLLEQFTTTLRAEYGVTVNERMLEDLLATF